MWDDGVHLPVASYYDDTDNEHGNMIRRLLRHLATRVAINEVTEEQVNEWRAFFRGIPDEPTPTFTSSLPAPRPPPGLDIKHQSEDASGCARGHRSVPPIDSKGVVGVIARRLHVESRGPDAEPIAFRGASAADMRREAEIKVLLAANTPTVGVFALLDCKTDDTEYKLPLSLGKIANIDSHTNSMTVLWYVYRGYRKPSRSPFTLKGPWDKQIIEGIDNKCETIEKSGAIKVRLFHSGSNF